MNTIEGNAMEFWQELHAFMFRGFKMTQNTDNFTWRLYIITSFLLIRDFTMQTVLSDFF